MFDLLMNAVGYASKCCSRCFNKGERLEGEHDTHHNTDFGDHNTITVTVNIKSGTQYNATQVAEAVKGMMLKRLSEHDTREIEMKDIPTTHEPVVLQLNAWESSITVRSLEELRNSSYYNSLGSEQRNLLESEYQSQVSHLAHNPVEIAGQLKYGAPSVDAFEEKID